MRIEFKSDRRNWKKEYSGLKPNTVRVFSYMKKKDIREEILNNFVNERLNILDIEIENTSTHERFVRRVKDVTFWNNEYIISW